MQRGGWGYHYQPGREVAAGSIDVHVHAVPGDHQRDGRRVVAMCALMTTGGERGEHSDHRRRPRTIVGALLAGQKYRLAGFVRSVFANTYLFELPIDIGFGIEDRRYRRCIVPNPVEAK